VLRDTAAPPLGKELFVDLNRSNFARWCGQGEDYCAAPYCQFNYGSGADTLQVPPGPVTSKVARTKLGTLPYGGVGIDDCIEPGVIALTFDDGPYIYTSAFSLILRAVLSDVVQAKSLMSWSSTT
jgi:hypothetical protein